MSEIKQRALEKMNEEMNQKHSRSIDAIHNWLCDQEDDELFEKICQEGKTLADAYHLNIVMEIVQWFQMKLCSAGLSIISNPNCKTSNHAI